MKKLLWILMLQVPFTYALAQHNLKNGFDKEEYIKLMYISSRQTDTPWVSPKYPIPDGFQMIYRSAVTGLDNRWDLWLNSNQQLAVISIRGTTQKGISWLENFFAAMQPAQGSIQISKHYTFTYKMAHDARAAVHTGWLIATACLSQTIIPKIDSLYSTGVKNILIVGHSQGGAIAFLLTAHLHYLQQAQQLPKDIFFKTYCSAAPKPGNIYFAYDYESYTQQGLAYNIINTADWVPETPATIQTVNDFNEVNPFTDIRKSTKKQKIGTKIAIRTVYRNLVHPTSKAQRKNQKYLGKKVYKIVKKTLPELKLQAYTKSSYYVRAGNIITLNGDDEYFHLFPQDKNKVFTHHSWESYLYLINKYNDAIKSKP